MELAQNEYGWGVGCLAGGNCGGVSAFPQNKTGPSHSSRFVRVVEGRTALSIETENSCSKQPHLRFSPPSWAREAAAAQSLTLTSPDIAPGATIAKEQVANVFGCTGGNVSPALSWSGAPAGTKSFALSVYDPDAPTGSGFWHWVVFNIPPDVTSLPKNAGDPKGAEAPKGAVQSRTDFGVPGYGGPCPPQGDPATPLSFHDLRRGHAEARR